MSDSPYSPGEISLTIKHTGKYEDPWTVFRGSPSTLKSQLIEFYGLGDPDDFAENTPNDVFMLALKQANAEYAAGTVLGAKTVSTKTAKKTAAKKAMKAKAEPEEEPVAASDSDNESSDENPIIAQISEINDVTDLQKLWANNQAAFEDEEVMKAWKARGKELSKK